MTVITDVLSGLALLLLAVWIAMFFAWGAFWQVWRYDADHDSIAPPAAWPRVVVIVPARNEAATIGRTISSLAGQNYPGEFHIIVVDDDSDDGTAPAARHAAIESDSSDRLEMTRAPSLPAGWTGKLSAMDAGVRAASRHAPQWLWFVDADVVAGPDTLRRLVSRASRDNLSLASLMVLLQARSFPERLLIPPFLYFFLMLYPPRCIADAKKRTAGAAGGCLLMRRDALDRMGGFASICDAVIDDCALARAVKKSGGRVWMGLTRTSVSIRAYGTLSEIRDMIARTAFTQLHYSAIELLGTLAGLAFTYLLPVGMAFSRVPLAWPLALLAWLLMSATFAPTLRFYRISLLFAPFLPLAALFYAHATGLSAVRYWFGRGATWKNRSQAPSRRLLAKSNPPLRR